MPGPDRASPMPHFRHARLISVMPGPDRASPIPGSLFVMPDLIGHLPLARRGQCSRSVRISGRALIGWRGFDGELLLLRSFGP